MSTSRSFLPLTAACSSQFFITLAPCPHLKGKHVVFGRVVGAKGLEVIQQIAKVAVDGKDKPLSPVEITHCGELVRKAPPVNIAPTRARSVSVSDGSNKQGRRRRSPSRSGSEDSDSDSDDSQSRKKRRKEEKRLRKEEKRAKKKAKKAARDERRSASPARPQKTEEELREEERRAEAEKALQEEEERQRIERRRRDLERLRRDDDADAPVVYKGTFCDRDKQISITDSLDRTRRDALS